MLTDLSRAMKNILYVALAGLLLIGFVEEQAATTTVTVQARQDWDDRSDDRDQREPAFRTDENAIQLIRTSLSADKSLPTNSKGVRLIVFRWNDYVTGFGYERAGKSQHWNDGKTVCWG